MTKYNPKTFAMWLILYVICSVVCAYGFAFAAAFWFVVGGVATIFSFTRLFHYALWDEEPITQTQQ